MSELEPGAARALDRLSRQLKEARRAYDIALLRLVPFVEEAARAGDSLAAYLLEELESARVREVTEAMAAREVLLQ